MKTGQCHGLVFKNSWVESQQELQVFRPILSVFIAAPDISYSLKCHTGVEKKASSLIED